MKKLIIFAGAMLLLAAGTVGFFANRPMSAQEALILKNVEAIADPEAYMNMVRTTNSCSITFEGAAGVSTTVQWLGRSWPITFDADGKFTITHSSGEIICDTGGTTVCTPRDC